jgi:phenylalanyl-tRNA synthetase beta chain
MLVIADANRSVAVAGVMGGAETEISPHTWNVLLESANFDPVSIRKTSRALGLSTEASYRFERGADVEMARFACNCAAALIQELAAGDVYRDVIDVYPRHRRPIVATLRRRRIESFLGMQVDDSLVDRIFHRLGFGTTRTRDGWSVEVPSYRLDIAREEDLLEEIARHHGFDKFPTTLPKWSGNGSGLPSERHERLLRNHLAAAGYSETIPMAFSDKATEQKFRPDVQPLELINPMAEDEAVLRTSLVPSMLRTIQWNANRGIRDVQLYEIGKAYQHDGETRSLIIAVTGSLRTKSVHEPEREFNFYDLKGDVTAILDAFRVKFHQEATRLPSYYHPGRAARVGDVLIFGELHPDVAREYKFKDRVYIAELDLELLFESSGQTSIASVPRFPSIKRDLSLLLNKTTRYGEVERAVRMPDIPELVRVEPFDRLESGPFPQSKYALAISLMYQSPERTLTDEEVESFDKRILDSLHKELGAELRQ